jgi:hypothetical protein
MGLVFVPLDDLGDSAELIVARLLAVAAGVEDQDQEDMEDGPPGRC